MIAQHRLTCKNSPFLYIHTYVYTVNTTIIIIIKHVPQQITMIHVNILIVKVHLFAIVTESRLPPLKPNIRARTLSAPATLQSHRIKSARIYSAKVRVPPARVRVQSAAPRIGDSGRISRPQSGRPAPLKEEREEERETKDNEEDIPEE